MVPGLLFPFLSITHYMRLGQDSWKNHVTGVNISTDIDIILFVLDLQLRTMTI